MTFPSHPTAFVPPLASLRPATTAASALPSSAAMESLPSLSSSSAHLLSTAIADEGRTFEAVAPDSSLLAGFGVVVLLCVVAGYVWANEVVPVSRTKLAISKSRGEVREYLDELKVDAAAAANEGVSNATTTVMEMGDGSMDATDDGVQMVKPNVGDGRDFERWLFSDWLNRPGAKGGRQKEPALPILKEAKWNSGDNPVLVTAAIMMVGIVLASITERVAT